MSLKTQKFLKKRVVFSVFLCCKKGGKEGQKQLKKYEMIESEKFFNWFLYSFIIVCAGLFMWGQDFMITLCYDIIESICGIESGFLAYILMLAMVGLFIFLVGFIFDAILKVQKKKILEIPEIKKYFHDSAAALEFEAQIDECEKGIARIRNAIEEQEKEKRLEIRTEKFNRVMDKVFGSSSGSSSGSGGYTHYIFDGHTRKLRRLEYTSVKVGTDIINCDKYIDDSGWYWFTANDGETFFRDSVSDGVSNLLLNKIIVCEGHRM